MAGRQIRGNKRFFNLHEESSRVGAAQIAAEYDSDEWTSGVVAAESQAGRVGSKLFQNVGVAHRVVIRADRDITVRWNSPTSPAFTVEAGIPFEEDRLEITDIYLSTTASTAVKVYMT